MGGDSWPGRFGRKEAPDVLPQLWFIVVLALVDREEGRSSESRSPSSERGHSPFQSDANKMILEIVEIIIVNGAGWYISFLLQLEVRLNV